jgi:hypothetical protein
MFATDMFSIEGTLRDGSLESPSNDWEVLSEDRWELLSNVSEVISIDAVATTYADVAKSGTESRGQAPSPPGTSAARTRPLMGVEKAAVLTSPKTIDSEFDAYFVMEGVKCAKGGRISLMFKGNPKTQKQWRARRR